MRRVVSGSGREEVSFVVVTSSGVGVYCYVSKGFSEVESRKWEVASIGAWAVCWGRSVVELCWCVSRRGRRCCGWLLIQ